MMPSLLYHMMFSPRDGEFSRPPTHHPLLRSRYPSDSLTGFNLHKRYLPGRLLIQYVDNLLSIFSGSFSHKGDDKRTSLADEPIMYG